ncbi:MAG TPA: YceI family protein [Hanamia sp.]|nr:YceI family protein [Hanamia sp.]
MKKALSLLAFTFLLHIAVTAQTLWKADPMHSKLTFTVTHFGINDIFGLFQKFDATATSSRPDFSDAVFDLSADVASINTEVKMRDDDLRSARFFDAEKFPKMTFKSSSIKAAGKNRFKLSGDLTMHGITKSVTMDLWFRGIVNDTISKTTKAGFQLTGTLNRADFKIGNVFPFNEISNDVRIKADGEFIKQ